jgi:hypothetical protein
MKSTLKRFIQKDTLELNLFGIHLDRGWSPHNWLATRMTIKITPCIEMVMEIPFFVVIHFQLLENFLFYEMLYITQSAFGVGPFNAITPSEVLWSNRRTILAFGLVYTDTNV